MKPTVTVIEPEKPGIRPLLLVGLVLSPLVFGWPVLMRPVNPWLKAGVILAMVLEFVFLAFGAPGELPALIGAFQLLN